MVALSEGSYVFSSFVGYVQLYPSGLSDNLITVCRKHTGTVKNCHQAAVGQSYCLNIAIVSQNFHLRYVQKTLTDTDFIDEDIADSEREMDLLTEMIRQTVMQNASASVTEDEYRRRYNDLTDRFRAEEEKHKRLTEKRKRMVAESIAIGGMLSELTELEAPPIEFDEKLWHATVDRVTVYNDDRLVYSLKDGSEITVML